VYQKLVEKWEVEGKGVRKSDGRGRKEQSKVYLQQGHVEKPL
jgi:hypothetical protein